MGILDCMLFMYLFVYLCKSEGACTKVNVEAEDNIQCLFPSTIWVLGYISSLGANVFTFPLWDFLMAHKVIF